MKDSQDPDLVKVTEVFLVPSSFLVAALGTADTNTHRAIVSVVGLIVSAMWWLCSQEALAEKRQLCESPPGPLTNRTKMFVWMPIVFVVGWIVSLVGHLMLWNRPLGQ